MAYNCLHVIGYDDDDGDDYQVGWAMGTNYHASRHSFSLGGMVRLANDR